MILALAAIGAYVLLVGGASFLESPDRGFDAVQLNGLVRFGSAALSVAVLVAIHGISMPPPLWLAAGLGLGLVAGAGSICYVFALNFLPVSLVVAVSNLSIVVTVVLGAAILRESVGLLKIGALVLTVVGALALSRASAKKSKTAVSGKHRELSSTVAAPARHGVRPAQPGASRENRLPGYGLLVLNLALVGASYFLEKPVLQHLDVFQLNALQTIGMLIVAAIALAARQQFPSPGRHMAVTIGVGAMIGLGSIFYFLGLMRLPVSIAVGLANGYVVVTILLSVLIGHATLPWSKRLAIALTVTGVILFVFAS